MIIRSIRCTITQVMEELISSSVNREGSHSMGQGGVNKEMVNLKPKDS